MVGCAPKSIKTEHFDISYYSLASSGEQLKADAEDALEKITNYFGTKFEGRITIKKRRSGGDFSGKANYRKNLIHIHTFERNILYHEVAHIVSAQGDPNPHRYLHEGVAVYMEELFVKDRFLAHYPGGAHKYSAEKKEHLVPLEELDSEPVFAYGKYFDSSYDHINLTYAQSASFVKYLIEKYGLEKFKDFFFNYKLYDEVYGKKLAALETEWLEYIQTVE